MAFVVDSSVAMAWCFPDEVTPYTEGVLDRLRTSEAVVSAIWPLEVANVLLVGLRRGRVTEAQVGDYLRILRALPIRVDGSSLHRAVGVVLNLAQAQQLTSYDASYLELAMREGLPLATQDDRLRDAAQRVGVPLLA